MSGGIHEANAMAGVGEKQSACAHAGEMAAFAFDAQVFLGYGKDSFLGQPYELLR